MATELLPCLLFPAYDPMATASVPCKLKPAFKPKATELPTVALILTPILMGCMEIKF
jgi:hypothetical protein